MKKFRHLVNIGLISTLVCMTVFLLYAVMTTSTCINIQNYNGIVFTSATLTALFFNKNIFTLLLGATLLVGNFCGLSSFSSITTYSWIFNINSLPIPLYWGQPEYSLMLFIYLIFNSRFFIGILTKEYWVDFTKRTHDLERVLVTIDAAKPIGKETTESNSEKKE